ncbi:secretion protein F [Lactiplantibacillus garii]|uniref:Secretion protein F n=1 Tax=Lactiplantibacillus garii TaxID=2306423 RepID=A0A3R8J5B1_9LACO|nr:type II secretion system F family protein [Lactiplantibacillus garii]RRK09546.1 secretion protein F [Lactiplantibacillus garii]
MNNLQRGVSVLTRPISLRKRNRLKPTVQATLFETLADLLQNGFSLRSAMRFIVDVQGPAFKPLRPVLSALAAGDSLAAALAPFIAVDLYYQLLIAEMHGQLTTTLIQAGQLMRTRSNQAQQIRRLLQYPCLLLVLLMGTLIMVKTAVLPNFSGLTSAPAQAVSWRLIIGSGCTVIGLGMVITIVQLKRLPVRTRYRWLARWPLVGPLIKTYTGYYLTLNAGMLLSGGLGIRAICEVSHRFRADSLLQQQGVFIERSLLAGHSLASTIRADVLLPDELALLVSKESPTEQLSQELVYFATVQYERLIRKLNRLISWIQPAMFLVIALVIIGTYLNILLPMYNSMGELLK